MEGGKMKSKLYVGLSFYMGTIQSRKIQTFTQRFDPKHYNSHWLTMSLMPPFEIERTDTEYLIDELREEMEAFYHGHSESYSMHFRGIDVHRYKRHQILFLNPELSSEMEHCQDSLFSICQSYIFQRERKSKDKKRFFLPIGRFKENYQLEVGYEVAKRELQLPLVLPVASVSLFEKKLGIWQERAVLHNFERDDELFLQKSAASL
jgi:hypothetical protein